MGAHERSSTQAMSAISKVVAITSANGGAGEAAARLLGAEGAKLLLGACTAEAHVRKVAADIRACGGSAEHKRVDVTSRASMEVFVRTAYERFGGLDVLVENAGLVSNLKPEDRERMIDSNVKGVLYGIAAALPFMAPNAVLHTINIAAFAGDVVLPSVAAYFAAKLAAPEFIDRAQRNSWPAIRVTVISPRAAEAGLEPKGSRSITAKSIKTLDQMTIQNYAVARDIVVAIKQRGSMDFGQILLRNGQVCSVSGTKRSWPYRSC